MRYVLQQLLDALSIGSTYMILALGLSLVFSVMGLINFAYGGLLVWGGYALIGAAALGVNLLVAVLILLLVTTFLSFLMGQVAFRPFRHAPPATLLLTSFGVLLVLQAAAIIAFGEVTRHVPTPALLGQGFLIGGIRISWLQVLTIGAGAIVLAGLTFLLARTDLGLKIRCVAEDTDIAEVLGIRSSRVLTYVFIISGVIAGIAAFVWFAKIGSVNPRADLNPMLKAFIAIVLGRMGTVRGAVVGGLGLGLFESVLAANLPSSLLSYQTALTFVLVVVVLLLRPQGLVGRTIEVSK